MVAVTDTGGFGSPPPRSLDGKCRGSWTPSDSKNGKAAPRLWAKTTSPLQRGAGAAQGSSRAPQRMEVSIQGLQGSHHPELTQLKAVSSSAGPTSRTGSLTVLSFSCLCKGSTSLAAGPVTQRHQIMREGETRLAGGDGYTAMKSPHSGLPAV